MSGGIKPSPFHIALWEFWAQKSTNLFTLATIFVIINYSLFLTPRSFAFYQHSWNYRNHETLVNSQKLHSSWYILTLTTIGKPWKSSSKNTYFNMQIPCFLKMESASSILAQNNSVLVHYNERTKRQKQYLKATYSLCFLCYVPSYWCSICWEPDIGWQLL